MGRYLQTPIGMTKLDADVVASGYQRPSDWLAMSAMVAGVTVQADLLVAVFDNDTNLIPFVFAESVNVDIGDGSGNTVYTAGTHTITFDYADYAGSECSRGYRQALVKITPDGVGQITKVEADGTLTGGGHDPNVAILSVKICCPDLTTFDLIGVTIAAVLEEVEFVGDANISTYSSFLKDLNNIKKVTFPDNIDSSLGANASWLYGSNFCLAEPPLIDLTGVTNAGFLHYHNHLLTVAPAYNTSSLTIASSMYAYAGISEAPSHDFSSLTLANAIYQSAKVNQIPAYNLDNATNVQSFAYACIHLLTMGAQSLPACTNLSYYVFGARSLRALHLSNLGNVTNILSAFKDTDSLSELTLGGLTIGFDISQSNMGAQALDDLADSLGTANGAQTIIITSNPGALTCTASKFTNKGYTLVQS